MSYTGYPDTELLILINLQNWFLQNLLLIKITRYVPMTRNTCSIIVHHHAKGSTITAVAIGASTSITGSLKSQFCSEATCKHRGYIRLRRKSVNNHGVWRNPEFKQIPNDPYTRKTVTSFFGNYDRVWGGRWTTSETGWGGYFLERLL